MFWLLADAQAYGQLCWPGTGKQSMPNQLSIGCFETSTRQAEHLWHQQHSFVDAVGKHKRHPDNG
jgi:hypothetical protein